MPPPPREDLPNADLLVRIPLSARVVLDVGCGTAALAAAYRKRNPRARLLGIDTDPAVAAVAAERLDELATVDVEDDPLPFDVSEGDRLHHLWRRAGAPAGSLGGADAATPRR